MKRFLLLIISIAGTAFAAPEIQVTFTNGAVRSLPALRVESGYLQLAEGRVEKSKISSVHFVTDPLTVDRCKALLAEGHYDEILGGLGAYRSSLLSAAGLPGNSEGLLRCLLEAFFWKEDYSSVQEISSSPQIVGTPIAVLASFYGSLAVIEQGRLDEASAQIAQLEKQLGITTVMGEYARARIAFAREQYVEALQHLAQGKLAHSRNAEWTTASLFLEGMIYNKTGRAEAAAYVADELGIGWPESIWARRLAELKGSKTE
jgi:hypothetical protein